MIIDSSVLIDIDRGDNIERLDKLDFSNSLISSATIMEISTGRYMRNVPASEFQKIYENLEVVPVNREIADTAGKIMAELIQKGERVEINDIYIAATSLVYNEPVLTGNAEHFERIEGLEVIDWEKL